MAHSRLGFVLRSSAVSGSIFVPRYYNPEITDRLAVLKRTHQLITLGELLRNNQIQVSAGDEIGKMAYGTGAIPFIRTSDISNWEIKADPKQGVSDTVYRQYARKQDVRAGDLFFVRDGTYLIGSCCLVTDTDSKILYQSHILKFRAVPEGPVSGPLLLALLSAPVVRRQIRAKQFTADIIDTIGNRYRELVLPLPRDRGVCSEIEQAVLSVVQTRATLREQLRRIPLFAQGLILNVSAEIPEADGVEFEPIGNPGFLIKSSRLRSAIFVPRYYDPVVDQELCDLAGTHDLMSMGEMVKRGMLSFSTGIEVGKMAYGTGPVPFIRTSDISNWELKADPKQSISEDLYELTKHKLDVRVGDIFVVRDGTYLVGTSCILTKQDAKITYCGGIYKIRVKKPDALDPYLLLALLNTPIVRRQMRAKQFTRDVIDTLGKRIFEVVIPIPRDSIKRQEIAKLTRETVETRAVLRNKAKQIALDVERIQQIKEEDRELLEAL